MHWPPEFGKVFMILEDGFSRRFHYLRLSLTEACNFRCTYCLPDGYRPDGRKSFLTVDEIRRVVHGFAELGVKKIRLTGGEPSMRRDLPAIIEIVANTAGIEKVAMTTNGYRLKERAAQWYDAGLRDLNVSIDSLDPRQFQLITGENKLAEILDGIEAAQAAGYHRIKVNSVLLKNLNDHELSQFLFWIKGQPIQLRLIELMQTGEMDARFQKHHQSGLPIKMRLLREGWLQQPKGQTDGPAEVFSHPDYLGQIGLIMPYSKDFCASCNRLRVSAVGKLHLCLFGEEGVALRDLLQEDSQHTELQTRILEGLTHKRETHFLHQGNSGVTPHLASIGG